MYIPERGAQIGPETGRFRDAGTRAGCRADDYTGPKTRGRNRALRGLSGVLTLYVIRSSASVADIEQCDRGRASECQ